MTPEEIAQAHQRRVAAQQQQNFAQQQMRTLREQEDLARAQRFAIQQSMASGGLFAPIPPSLNFGELDKGSKSYLPAKKVESWPAKQAYAHWLEGQGQPVEVPFRSLHFQDGHFRVESDLQKEVAKLTSQAQLKGHIVMQDIDLKNQKFEFDVSKNISDYATYGNIMVDVKGALTVDPSGNWQFEGKLFPGYGAILNRKPFRGDIFDFNPATHRSLPAEIATRSLHTLPGTRYYIYFKEESVSVKLDYRVYPRKNRIHFFSGGQGVEQVKL